jgi:8-oxo-dGTP diphosphatase
MQSTVLVGGVIHKDGKILILRRPESKKFFPGCWEIPGGKLDKGESLEEAVIREAREETNLHTKVDRLFFAWTDTLVYKDEKGLDDEEHVVGIGFILTIRDAIAIRLSEKEHSEFRWVGSDELPEKMTFQMRKMVERAFSELRQ